VKSYKNWTTEVFKIAKVQKTIPRHIWKITRENLSLENSVNMMIASRC